MTLGHLALPAQILFSREQISDRVQALGAQITHDYQGKSLVVLGILKGSFLFLADLVRAIELPMRIEFLGVRSYGAQTKSTGVVQITQDLTNTIVGEDVLIVEDIVDTGLTLDYLLHQLETRKPASLKICTLLDKPSRRKRELRVDYTGFVVKDQFVVGYGLDYDQTYRNLSFIAALAPDQAKQGS